MKKKLLTLAFGLLLAVGWTNVAQAQLKRAEVPQFHKFEAGRPAKAAGQMSTAAGQPSRAPLRANVTARKTYPRSFYEGFSYTWSGGTSKITEIATDPDQMANLVKFIYTEPQIPGILYSAAHGEDHPYENIEFGWDIAQPATNSTDYGDIYIEFPNYFINISSIYVYSGNTRLTYWTATNNGSNLPNNWSTDGTLGNNGDGTYFPYTDINNTWAGMHILIPASIINGRSNIRVVVNGFVDSQVAENYMYFNQMYVNHQPKYLTTSSAAYEWTVRAKSATGTVTPPSENGYTTLLVKVKDNIRVDQNNDEFTFSWNDITNYFSKYIESIELLTDGMRVGENTDAAGTVFAYTGILDKFFFISKGKMAYLSSLESSMTADRAPFYGMYEEFSPYVESQVANQKDMYANMRAGEYYPIIHDCNSVMFMDHYFSMAGKDTIAPKSVAPIVLYIPDNRGSEGTWRNYVDGFQPQVGLYTINLAAETEPAVDYNEANPEYTVYLDWSSSLNDMANNQVDQTYIIYKVTFDDHGERVYTPLDTVYDELNYQYNEPQLMTSQTFTYVIMGFPNDATNNPWNQQGGIFYVYSNIDDVQIPGLFDFMVLYRERYESDFVIHEQKNYYRNYLYPTNLSPGTGMTMEQLKKEWPDQTASYTLWRDDRGIAKLEIRAVGNKVYYRIQYYEGSQVTNAPNNIEMPYPFVEIPNENN